MNQSNKWEVEGGRTGKGRLKKGCDANCTNQSFIRIYEDAAGAGAAPGMVKAFGVSQVKSGSFRPK